MKSKLLKLKQMICNSWPFITMYAVGGVSLFIGGYRHSLIESLLALAYVLTALGWHKEKNKSITLASIVDGVMKNNDELITINKELSTKNQEQSNLIGGIISENKDLKLKLKNAKMEASRLRNKGGKKNE